MQRCLGGTARSIGYSSLSWLQQPSEKHPSQSRQYTAGDSSALEGIDSQMDELGRGNEACASHEDLENVSQRNQASRSSTSFARCFRGQDGSVARQHDTDGGMALDLVPVEARCQIQSFDRGSAGRRFRTTHPELGGSESEQVTADEPMVSGEQPFVSTAQRHLQTSLASSPIAGLRDMCTRRGLRSSEGRDQLIARAVGDMAIYLHRARSEEQSAGHRTRH